MDYRKMWYRLRKKLMETSKQEQCRTIDERNYNYEDVFAKEILFQMLEMEEELELAEEKILEE